jgi:origin recognition complex subunit 3
MYQSAGKMINLADWYQAFSQSILPSGDSKSSTSSTTGSHKKRKHARENDDDDEEGVDDENDNQSTLVKRDAVQARFALAVCELGKMGFLKKTRRKPDHVLKIVHDLPPPV